MNKILILFLFPLMVFSQTSKDFISSKPHWVNILQYDENLDSLDSGGKKYLLYDNQWKTDEKHNYYRHVVKLETAEALQSYSILSFDYDPSFESFYIHEISVLREGKLINKLSIDDINSFQRETNIERSLYDGSITVSINLSDIRKGDILDYSYSYLGNNPAFKDHSYAYQKLQFGTAIGRIHYKVISPKESKLIYFKVKTDYEPKVDIQKNQRIYTIDLKRTEPKFHFDKTPSWYINYPAIIFTDYHNWSEIAQDIQPLYEYSTDEIAFLRQKVQEISKAKDSSRIAMDLMRFVQDDIRYLGFESGLNAFKPHSVKKVYKQRFGDCKDKSYLLCGLYKAAGFQAYPVLVNTYTNEGLNDENLSPYSFNHCVVNLKYKGEDVFIDPTISSLGGDIFNTYFPPYNKGLILNYNANKLSELKHENKGGEYVLDEITIPSKKSDAGKLVVTTEFRGIEADNSRSYLRNSSKESIQKDYLNYYSSIYPHIKVDKAIEIEDNRESNAISIKEYYLIDSIWYKQDGIYYVDIYSLQTRNYATISENAERTVPYALDYPLNLRHQIKVNLPEEWTIKDEDINIDKEDYNFSLKVSSNNQGDKLLLEYQLKTINDFVSVENYNEFVNDFSEIYGDSYYYISDYGEDYEESGLFNFFFWFLALLVLAISILFCVRLYFRYDPPVDLEYSAESKIGGWLILPAIGICISPLVLLFQFYYTEGILDPNTLFLVLNKESPSYSPNLGGLIILENLYNILLFSFTVLCIIVFFKRRSSAPMLMIAYYLVNLVVLLVDTIWANQLFDEGVIFVPEDIKDILRQLLGVLIWVPYFYYSNRVKETFVIRLRGDKENETME